MMSLALVVVEIDVQIIGTDSSCQKHYFADSILRLVEIIWGSDVWKFYVCSIIKLFYHYFIMHFTKFSKNIFFANLLSFLNSIRYRSNRFLIIWSSNSIFAKVSFQSNLSVQYVLVCNFVYVITPDIYSYYASLKLLSHVLCVCQFAINFFYSFFVLLMGNWRFYNIKKKLQHDQRWK